MSDGKARDAATPAEAKATRREWVGLAVISLPCMLYSMDMTVLHLAVPQIAERMRPSSAELLWIVDIYGFMVAGALITMGTLGDRIGRRRILLIGSAAFGITSILAAFSTTPALLIANRAVQGVAAATLAPSTLSLIRNMFHDADERALAIGIWLASFSGGAALGPLVGGVVLEHFWWGAVFLINVPIMLLLLAVGPFLLPEFRDPEAGRMDIVSAAQSVVAVLSVIYGIKRIAESGWALSHGVVILFGLAVAVLFLRRQRRLDDPLIDVRLFAVPTLGAALLINVAGLFVIFGTFLFIAQYLQLVVGMTPLEAGIWTAPSGLVFALGSLAAPPLLRHFSAATVISTGFLVASLGFALIAQVGPTQSPWLLFWGMIIFCLGLAPNGTITTDIMMTEAPPARAGAASAVSETSFEFGGALGIAVLGSILTAVYRGAIADAGHAGIPPELVAQAMDSLGGAAEAAKALPGDSGAILIGTARAAFVHAFQVICAVSAAGCFLAAGFAAVVMRRS
jgi:DHA2 family multidrug resistance protein-like MFS transporter